MRRVVLLLICLSVLLCLHLFAEQKRLKSVKPTKSKDYVYLSSEEDSLPLVQVGKGRKIKALGKRALCFHEGHIWLGLRYFDKEAGKVLSPVVERGVRGGGYGICTDGKLIWVLDTEKKELRGYSVEGKGGGMKLSFNEENKLALPCSQPTAVTFTDKHFYVLDVAEKRIVKVTSRGKAVANFPAPSEDVVDIAYDGNYFWAVDKKRKTVYVFEEHGVVIVKIPLRFEEFEPTGIAYDGELIWIYGIPNEGATDGELRAFRLNEKQKYTLGAWMEADVCFKVEGGRTTYIAIPQHLNCQKILTKIEFNKEGEIVEDNWRQKVVKFSGDGELKLRVRIWRLRYNIIPEEVGGFSKIPGKIKKAYTIDGDMLKISSVEVQKAKQEAEKLLKKWKKKRTPYWVARCAYEYLIRKVHYERIPGWVDAPTLLRRGKGTCSPISFAYVAICRALGLPARFSAGTCYRGKDPSVDREFHRWCEVYLPNYGWVPIDPSACGKNPSPLSAINQWGNVPHSILIMMAGGGGSNIFGWAYNGAGGRNLAHWSNIKEGK